MGFSRRRKSSIGASSFPPLKNHHKHEGLRCYVRRCGFRRRRALVGLRWCLRIRSPRCLRQVRPLRQRRQPARPMCCWPEHHIKDCRTCATFANSIPDLVFEDCPYGEKWGRIVMFFQCEHEQKYKTCMNHDMKQKLEKSFGKIEDLEQATGLPEYQLLPLTMKLLHEQMDMFNM